MALRCMGKSDASMTLIALETKGVLLCRWLCWSSASHAVEPGIYGQV